VFARQKGGRFILRFDDTDVARSQLEYAIGIEQDLQRLGIVPDVTIRQSDRAALYDRAVEQLKASRALFHPLRLVLTGRENGPELAALLPLIGYARASARLSGSSV
jgi:glutamyl-tRNA synthetase